MLDRAGLKKTLLVISLLTPCHYTKLKFRKQSNKTPSLTLYICVICLLLLPRSLSSMLTRRWR